MARKCITHNSSISRYIVPVRDRNLGREDMTEAVEVHSMEKWNWGVSLAARKSQKVSAIAKCINRTHIYTEHSDWRLWRNLNVAEKSRDAHYCLEMVLRVKVIVQLYEYRRIVTVCFLLIFVFLNIKKH